MTRRGGIVLLVIVLVVAATQVSAAAEPVVAVRKGGTYQSWDYSRPALSYPPEYPTWTDCMTYYSEHWYPPPGTLIERVWFRCASSSGTTQIAYIEWSEPGGTGSQLLRYVLTADPVLHEEYIPLLWTRIRLGLWTDGDDHGDGWIYLVKIQLTDQSFVYFTEPTWSGFQPTVPAPQAPDIPTAPPPPGLPPPTWPETPVIPPDTPIPPEQYPDLPNDDWAPLPDTPLDPVPTPEDPPETDPVPTPEDPPETDPVPTPDELPETDPVPTPDELPETDPVPTPDELPETDPVPTPDELPETDPVPAPDDLPETDPLPPVDPLPEVDPIPEPDPLPAGGD